MGISIPEGSTLTPKAVHPQEGTALLSQGAVFKHCKDPFEKIPLTQRETGILGKASSAPDR